MINVTDNKLVTNYFSENLNELIMKTNMASWDRIGRVVIFTVVVILFFTKVIMGTVAFVLLGVATVLLLTSVINFCPLYRLFGINTCKVK